MVYNAVLDNTGIKNPSWKGDGVGYFGLHEYLRKHFPPPENCQICKKKTNILDLANTTGIYKRDVNNFKYLCRSCHNKLDGKIRYLGQYANIKGKSHLANLGKKKAGILFKYPGISKVRKSEKYQCSVMFKKQRYYLGAFTTEEEAYAVYKNKIKELLESEN